MSTEERKAVRLDGSRRHHKLAPGLTLNTPEGLQGQIELGTWSEAIGRDERVRGLEPPPGLADRPDHPRLFQPLGPSAMRGESLGYVLNLTIDERSQQLVTEENPLILKLPPGDVDGAVDLLPLAFDGEDYLPIGYPSADLRTVRVVRLPPPARAAPALRVITPRGMADAIQLFIYKKLGQHHKIPYLRYVSVDQDSIEYEDIQSNTFSKGNKVAVFVHGFASDTRGVITQSASMGANSKVRLFRNRGQRFAGLEYDHVLAFDYEGFGTTVDSNGKQFFDDLKDKCRFNDQDEIIVHVYAHSMGCMVSRCMIERSGGHEFIDRLVLAGAPNYGSPIAETPRGLVFLLTVLINLWTPIPPLGAVGTWLVRKFFAQGVAPKDLEPGSKLVKDLYAPKTPQLDVRYLVLAGQNRVPEEKELLKRLWAKVMRGVGAGLDVFLGEPNDAAIPARSMKKLRRKRFTEVRISSLPCHHFDYYEYHPHRPDGPTRIRKWVS